jgi:hypothetical protein
VVQRILTWEPPLPVFVVLVLAVTCGTSLAIDGRVDGFAFVLAAAATGGHLAHRRRPRREVRR